MLNVELVLTGVPAVLALMPGLSAAYLVCLIVGGGLLVISTVFGGDSSDTGLDGDVSGGDLDFDVDVSDSAVHSDPSVLALTRWFSMQFVIYGVATFGLVGTVLTYVSGLEARAALVVSVAAGVVIGQLAHHAMHYIRRTGGNSAVQPQDYLDRMGRVSVVIGPDGPGEVAVQVRGVERFVPAMAASAEARFAAGQTVRVVAFRAGSVEVVATDRQ